MAEEPEQVLPQQRIAALAAAKNGQPKARSSSSMIVARITAGKAKTIIPAKISMVQAKIGILSSVMPGRARPQHADDDLDGARNGGDLDEADAQQPEVRADARRVLRCWSAADT